MSANPTGPSSRACKGGSTEMLFPDYWSLLVSVKEYYVNDGGAQIGVLVRTVYYRYLQKLGEDIDLPDGSYQGDYLLPLAGNLIDKFEETQILKSMKEIRLFVNCLWNI